MSHQYSFASFEEFLKFWSGLDDAEKNCCAERIPNEALSLADKNGWTAAHELAESSCLVSGNRTMTAEILRMANNDGWTVAHELAIQGCFPKEWMKAGILLLQNLGGSTVAGILARERRLPPELITPFMANIDISVDCVTLDENRYTVLDHFTEQLFYLDDDATAEEKLRLLPSDTIRLLKQEYFGPNGNTDGFENLVAILDKIIAGHDLREAEESISSGEGICCDCSEELYGVQDYSDRIRG